MNKTRQIRIQFKMFQENENKFKNTVRKNHFPQNKSLQRKIQNRKSVSQYVKA